MTNTYSEMNKNDSKMINNGSKMNENESNIRQRRSDAATQPSLEVYCRLLLSATQLSGAVCCRLCHLCRLCRL